MVCCAGIIATQFFPALASEERLYKSLVARRSCNPHRSEGESMGWFSLFGFAKLFLHVRHRQIPSSGICNLQCCIIAAIDVLSPPEWLAQHLEVSQYILR